MQLCGRTSPQSYLRGSDKLVSSLDRLDLGPGLPRPLMAGMESAPGGLAEHLQNWRHHLSATERHGLTLRCVRFLREHWINVFTSLLSLVFNFVDIVLAESRNATRVPLRFMIGAYSGTASFLILTRRKHMADEALRLAASVANTLEREGSPSDQV
ncbi:uncharacterized protein LOC127748770 [Frankliniella occidentalis]|uniref:Uncharacterized protein LOC127748770 n=1 Tax=Frankliniella occidentalis TaxID=133901 RepID=A0A9C6WKT7_FRAOC|nr:uncharacterized protein LOC127748770 [Frankliniella occidentalis]